MEISKHSPTTCMIVTMDETDMLQAIRLWLAQQEVHDDAEMLSIQAIYQPPHSVSEADQDGKRIASLPHHIHLMFSNLAPDPFPHQERDDAAT